MNSEINLAWMYPDILNLHGERGNVQAFKYVAEKLGIKLNIIRIDDIEEVINFKDIDIMLFNSGELKVLPTIIASLNNQKEELDKYIKDNKFIIATGTTGAMLGNEIKRVEEDSFKGLGLLNMDVEERKTVIGDDLYFTIDDKMEIMGSQIQMIDIKLKKSKPFGTIKYGYGNNGEGQEGAINGNVIFTNCLGPIFVKNPWLAEKVIRNICEQKKIENLNKEEIKYEIENKSLESLKEFINKKICHCQ